MSSLLWPSRVRLFALALLPGAIAIDLGLNLPPTQGTTRDGAFFPGLYNYEYRPEQVTAAFHEAGFTAVRLGINVESAHDVRLLQNLKGYIDSVGGHGLICMFDTSTQAGAPWPRTGRIADFPRMIHAWRNIHTVFASYGDKVRYELFNEPWGYESNATWYVQDMTYLIQQAQLPPDRCVVAGLYGSADILSVARAGWSGYLALHWYTFYLPEGQRTPEQYSARIQQSMQGVSNRVFITEYGTGLDNLKLDVDQDEVKWDVVKHDNRQTYLADWENEENQQRESDLLESMCQMDPGQSWCKTLHRGAPKSKSLAQRARGHSTAQVHEPKLSSYHSDTISFLRGLRDALAVYKRQGVGIMGLYHWHGWHNGDTWDFWDAANAQSSRMIQLIMSDLAQSSAAKTHDPITKELDAWSDDFVNDDQQVHMMILGKSGPFSSEVCPTECGEAKCAVGNGMQIGGKHLTAGHCTHICSEPYNGWRYCGTGAQYATAGAVDCSMCARPLMCAGLPCWTAQSSTHKMAKPVKRAKVHPHLTQPSLRGRR